MAILAFDSATRRISTLQPLAALFASASYTQARIAGSATVVGVGASVAAGVAAAQGASTAAAVGISFASSAAGSASGQATAAAVGSAASDRGAAAAAGSSTTAVVGAATAAAVAACSGKAIICDARSAPVESGDAEAAGVATATGRGSSLVGSVGAAAGVASVAAYSPRVAVTAAGVATASAVGNSILGGSGTIAAAGAASGSATAAGVGVATAAATAASSGASAGAATSTVTQGAASAAGTATASGAGASSFAGASPMAGGTMSAASGLQILAPNNALRTGLLTDVDWGPVALNDDSLGPRYQHWHAAYFGGAVYARPASSSTWVELRTLSDVTEVSFTFDHQSRAVLAYVRLGVAWVSWWNGSAWVDVALGSGARGPMVAQAGDSGVPDSRIGVVVAYVRAGSLYTRQSSDAFALEVLAAVAPVSSTRVQRMGMASTGEFVVELDGDEGSVTTLCQDLLTDTLYCASGAQAIPLFAGSRLSATWRSRVVLADLRTLPGWARIDGPFDAAVLRVYGDGLLVYTTPTIANNLPVRLPAGRYRELEFEVESDGIVTAVVMASSSEELSEA